jgi:hypothetical protein
MAKIDYTKAENLLSEGLLKMSIKQLIQLADKTSSFTDPLHPSSLPSVQARTILLTFMENDIDKIMKAEEGFPNKKMGVSKKQIRGIIEKITELTLEDWKKLKVIRERILKYKKELGSKIPHKSNEEIVEEERKKHINKRFNKRDKWLPLH